MLVKSLNLKLLKVLRHYICKNVLGAKCIYSQTCIKRSPLGQKRSSIHMTFSMTGQEKGHILIQVTA
jgi:hypothetical protein